MSTHTWTLLADWDKPLTSLNDRLHWAVVKQATLRCKAWAQDGATAQLIPPLSHCIVEMVWVVPDRRVRDEENPILDFKAACDGLVNAGVVPDDKPGYMTKLMPRIEYIKGEKRVFLLITGEPVVAE
jgi:crossover junction endodeoxyribonuclease RusA